MVISSGFLSISIVSIKLQKSFSLMLGPVLIFLGMIQADLFNLQKFYKGRIIKFLQSKKWNGMEVFPFGILVALSFCPATAAIFFGLLIPMAVRFDQMVLFPLIYAFGASLPVIVISLMISKGAVISAKARWIGLLPIISGWLLIIIGIYISLKRIYLV
jgi:cytochrome c biogenesis protein CcdA